MQRSVWLHEYSMIQWSRLSAWDHYIKMVTNSVNVTHTRSLAALRSIVVTNFCFLRFSCSCGCWSSRTFRSHAQQQSKRTTSSYGARAPPKTVSHGRSCTSETISEDFYKTTEQYRRYNFRFHLVPYMAYFVVVYTFSFHAHFFGMQRGRCFAVLSTVHDLTSFVFKWARYIVSYMVSGYEVVVDAFSLLYMHM